MMGIFSDMETGTKILVIAVLVLIVVFGGKNVLRDDGGKGNKGNKGSGSGE